jgi:hypothetical protein
VQCAVGLACLLQEVISPDQREDTSVCGTSEDDSKDMTPPTFSTMVNSKPMTIRRAGGTSNKKTQSTVNYRDSILACVFVVNIPGNVCDALFRLCQAICFER